MWEAVCTEGWQPVRLVCVPRSWIKVQSCVWAHEGLPVWVAGCLPCLDIRQQRDGSCYHRRRLHGWCLLDPWQGWVEAAHLVLCRRLGGREANSPPLRVLQLQPRCGLAVLHTFCWKRLLLWQWQRNCLMEACILYRPPVGWRWVWSLQHLLPVQPSSLVLQDPPPAHHRRPGD